jgi:AbrB family looped-hinge helix DNA binding protein
MAASSSRLSSKGQIVIPKRLRDELSFNEGDDLVMIVRGDILVIKKLTLDDIMRDTDRQYEVGETLDLDDAFRDLV